jgi:hypothetical protein
MRVDGNNMQNNSMPINCGMKGMHESSKAEQVKQNSVKNDAIKEVQKISMEKHKGSHIGLKI